MTEGSDTIFSKIIRREIPAQIVFENDKVLAFRDISPQAPTHILVIPKQALKDLASAQPQDAALLGELLLAVAAIARKEGLEAGGYRVVINNGAGAGQTVFHLHMHILGGRKFAWPPG
ncbi:MAG: histidine triad nucleotide-binding protein [Deltaproteobacteria bacterium]|nr:histidine triad nucleotide-binding protein [Deltaproteobacteria bacterium]